MNVFISKLKYYSLLFQGQRYRALKIQFPLFLSHDRSLRVTDKWTFTSHRLVVCRTEGQWCPTSPD